MRAPDMTWAKSFGRWLRPSMRARRLSVAITVAVAFGGVTFLTVWHSGTARLEVEGRSLAWAVLVAFGITWSTPRRELRGVAGMVLGAFAAFAALYALSNLDLLPLTPLAIGLTLGVVGVAGSFGCYVFARQFAFGGMAAGYGLALAAVLMAGFGPTTSSGDLAGILVVVVMAAIFGGAAAGVLRALTEVAAQPAARIAEIIHLPRRSGDHEEEFAHGVEEDRDRGWESVGARDLVARVMPKQRNANRSGKKAAR